jgi:hypothetical protein
MIFLSPKRVDTSNLSTGSFYSEYGKIFRIFFKQGEFDEIVLCTWGGMR